MFDAVISSSIGHLGIRCHQDKLISIEFLGQDVVPLPSMRISLPLNAIIKQLRAYFSQAQPLHKVSHELHGTPFQRKVWQAMKKIPLGTTCTYGELAQKLNTSARAIGMACRKNPLPLIVPCHRVVASNHLGGFGGKTCGPMLDIKQWLLAHERQNMVAYR